MSCSANVQLPDPEPGLLRLPSSIRWRIYELIGTCSLDPTESQTFDLNGHSQSPKSASLLLSCRTIYNELSRQLYSINRFVIRYNDAPQSLQSVKNLRPVTVEAMRHLKIILAEASCHYWQDQAGGAWELGQCCTDPDDVHSHQIKWCERNHHHDEPLGVLDPRTQACLAEWDAAAAYLAPLLAEGALDLALVCDISLGTDYSIAKSAV